MNAVKDTTQDRDDQTPGARQAARDVRHASAIEAAYLLELSRPSRLTHRPPETFDC
jgi:hypothetical protein